MCSTSSKTQHEKGMGGKCRWRKLLNQDIQLKRKKKKAQPKYLRATFQQRALQGISVQSRDVDKLYFLVVFSKKSLQTWPSCRRADPTFPCYTPALILTLSETGLLQGRRWWGHILILLSFFSHTDPDITQSVYLVSESKGYLQVFHRGAKNCVGQWVTRWPSCCVEQLKRF